jgi:hypothetical protein
MTSDTGGVRPGHVYPAFEREIDASIAWVSGKVLRGCGYSTATLISRFGQRLAELSLGPYILKVAGQRAAGAPPLPKPGTAIDCGRFNLETGSGRISFSARQFLGNAVEFMTHWGLGLMSIIAGIWHGKSDRPATLVFGIGVESLFTDGDDSRFVHYCRNGPVGPLKTGSRFLIQCATKGGLGRSPDFDYVRHPLPTLLRQVRLGFGARGALLVAHVMLPFSFLRTILGCPPLVLLGRDFAYARIAGMLDEQGMIEAVVLTCGNCTAQPLWMREPRRFETHMVWYAQNWKPLVYRSDGLAYDAPSLRGVKVNVHWVWTKAFGEFLLSHTSANRIEVVGPILWYMPEDRPVSAGAIEIAVFDVSAFSDELGERLGLLENYYRPSHLFAFMQGVLQLRGILEQRFGLPVKIRLKQKRDYRPIYDRGYFDYVNQLASEGSIIAVPPSENIYSLIAGSHVVIVYPYSSPAHVADFMHVPAIYYDPTGTLMPSYDATPNIEFAQSPETLAAAAITAVKTRIDRNAGITPDAKEIPGHPGFAPAGR